jgi:hypothetical protein
MVVDNKTGTNTISSNNTKEVVAISTTITTNSSSSNTTTNNMACPHLLSQVRCTQASTHHQELGDQVVSTHTQ